jgi:hypothetical protein
MTIPVPGATDGLGRAVAHCLTLRDPTLPNALEYVICCVESPHANPDRNRRNSVYGFTPSVDRALRRVQERPPRPTPLVVADNAMKQTTMSLPV